MAAKPASSKPKADRRALRLTRWHSNPPPGSFALRARCAPCPDAVNARPPVNHSQAYHGGGLVLGDATGCDALPVHP
eukprot:1913107-Prymnesium_polylepis.1